MLCDDLILDKDLPRWYDGLEKVFAKIHRAQKFVLTKEFAIAADGLVENYPELRKVVPYCRIPYPLTWIEWLHRDRPHWDPEDRRYDARPVDPTRHQQEPHRIGILMQQFDKSSRWRTHLFWSMVQQPPPGQSRFNGSIQSIEFNSEADPGDHLEGTIHHGLSEFGQKLVVHLMEEQPELAKRFLEYSVEDWGGEVRFMTAILGLLNTRNVAETTHVDNEAANVKRARHGKRPLFSHKILKIRPSIMAPRGQGSGDHRDVRLHFVRGHFKQRTSGLFWWSTHVRGKLEHGYVSKDYEVTD
jgi:hypothetical protein